MNHPFVRVLGSADWHPTKGNDHSCYTLNDELLIDAGAGHLLSLLNSDLEPSDFPVIFFTHMHIDHMMGLPALLHHHRVVKGTLNNLTIVGPKATVRAGFQRALDFALIDHANIHDDPTQHPTIVELDDGESFELPHWHVDVMASDHAVPGLCYRFTHRETGRTVGFSGDTRYLPGFADFFRNVDLLLYECSLGGGPVDEAINIHCRHSSAMEAAQVCKEANVKRLLLTHTYEPNRKAALQSARERLAIPVDWAMPIEKFEI